LPRKSLLPGFLRSSAAVLLLTVVPAGCGAGAGADAGAGDGADTGGQDAGTTIMVLDGELEVTVEGFGLYMGTDGTDLTLRLRAPTTGWVAVGFDPSSMMKDADIVIGYVSGDGVFVRDDWGTGPTSHQPDTALGGTDDVTGVSGEESDGVTTISFTIPLDSGDPYDRELEAGTHEVLIAFGPDGAEGFEGHHSWVKVVDVEFSFD
jgi:hypothetical protein